MVKVKAHELREKSKEDLLKQLEDLKNELAQLRVAKVSGQGGPSKLGKIRVIRKSIARVLTVFNTNARAAVRKDTQKNKYKPLYLRPKLTRALRREITPRQRRLKSQRVITRKRNFPKRKYAIRAA